MTVPYTGYFTVASHNVIQFVSHVMYTKVYPVMYTNMYLEMYPMLYLKVYLTCFPCVISDFFYAVINSETYNQIWKKKKICQIYFGFPLQPVRLGFEHYHVRLHSSKSLWLCGSPNFVKWSDCFQIARCFDCFPICVLQTSSLVLMCYRFSVTLFQVG